MSRKRIVQKGKFREGLATAQQGGEWLHIGRNGKPAYTKRFKFTRSFHEGVAAVQLANGKWIFVDHQGEPAFKGTFIEVRDFHKGRAVVKLADGWCHIDIRGKPIYPYRFDLLGNFNRGVARAKKDGKHFFIGYDGTMAR